MSTDYTNNFANDPYAIDAQRIQEEVENKGNSGPKVKWHNLPQGAAASHWRILPYVQKRSFYFVVTKHWHVPGFKGAVTCPRSFDDPTNPGKKLRCAICEKFFTMLKSKDPAEVAIAKQVLKPSQSYYVNAVNMDKPEEGVGVLTLPYTPWKTLYDWLGNPRLGMFSHPFHGRNIEIKSSIVAGAKVNGNDKREYTVMPDDPSPIANKEWLDQLYDLEKVLGIPTYDLTEVCLQRLIAGDENVAKLPEGTPAYRGQLMAPKEETQAPPSQTGAEDDFYKEQPVQKFQTTQEVRTAENIPPFTPTSGPAIQSEPPKFVSAPTVSTLNQPQTGFMAAAPAEPSKDDMIAQLQRQLAALQNGGAPTLTFEHGTGVKVQPVVETAPATTSTMGETDIRAMMEAALNGKLKQ